jgi:MoaA/NifB/PqqE/SkfB family radical SAM enzyme
MVPANSKSKPRPPKIIKKTVIFTDYNCNNNCIFCIDAEKRGIEGKSTKTVRREIAEARKRGSTYLEIIGGEPTARNDISGLIAFASGLGFKTITITTNGRMLSYPDFTAKIIKAGLTNIVFSIHGHTAELHDSLTQVKGSFDQLSAGIKNFRKFGFKNIGSNTTIVKQNYKFLPEIGHFLLGKGIKNAEFIFVDPNYGAAKINFDMLVPKISVIAPYVKKCLEIGKKNQADHWHVRYVPLCYFPDNLDQISEIDEVKKFRSEHIAPDFENYSVESSRAAIGRVKPEKCRSCRLYDLCEGIWREYVKQYGDDELKPITKLEISSAAASRY